MDPSRSPSAPPPGWVADEKSTVGQAPPPAYQESINPGHLQPGLGYPQGYGSSPQYGQQQYNIGASQPYQGQPGTVIVQPLSYVTQTPLAHQVNDYLGYSIFTMLCCCLPIGIAALIYSISTRDANHAGDQMSAQRSSRMARILNHTALGIGICVSILCTIYVSVVMTMYQ